MGNMHITMMELEGMHLDATGMIFDQVHGHAECSTKTLWVMNMLVNDDDS